MSDLQTLTALYEATRRIGLADSLDELLDTVLTRAKELIGFDHGALMLLDAERQVLRVRRVHGYGDRAAQIRDMELPVSQGLSGWAVRNRQAARVGDVRNDPRYVEGLPQCRSNLAVPLIVANEVAGAINVESERTDAFDAEHEKLLTVLGSQAALAILAARARGRLERRIDELNALYRISQVIAGEAELSERLASILEAAEGLVPEGHMAVLLAEDGTRTLRIGASRGYRGDIGTLRIPVGEGITGRCALRGEEVVVSDVREDPGYIPGVEDARSEIAIPLKVEGRIIGVLNAESTAIGAYREEEARALRVIAQQAAVVIQTSLLHEEARRLAITDPLTGLHNRRYFVEKLEEHLQRAGRYGQALALVLVDADRLKAINDRHGHLAGDRALQGVAEVLRAALRETDELARIGGDEFAALLLEASPERADSVTRRLRTRVRDLTVLSDEGHPLAVTVSAGLAFFPENGVDAKSLLREADLALYRAKREGRNQMATAGREPARS